MSNGSHKANFIKPIILALMIFGTIQLMSLTIRLMPLNYSWCGTTRTALTINGWAYSLFLCPAAIVTVVISWKKSTRIDFLLRISCVALIVSSMLFIILKWYLP
jgi:hypothetical protein